MGGGGEERGGGIRALLPYLAGHDPFQLEALRFKIANPTASLYNNRTQLLAALEFACLDLMGQHLDVPVHDLLGGKLRVAGAVRLLPVLPLRGRGLRRGAHSARPARRTRQIG
ncbi:hypothetical protein [Nonomuraea dietziae]|uniref:hypothetical protein n=1 Tax=Nonomuraea dietziae TaxID=65515 RepID=UPI0031D239B3